MAENEYFGLVMSNLKLNIKDEKKKKTHNKILMNIFKTFIVSYMKFYRQDFFFLNDQPVFFNVTTLF